MTRRHLDDRVRQTSGDGAGHPDAGAVRGVSLPTSRGPVSRWVISRLVGRPTVSTPPIGDADPIGDDDRHLALHCLYELNYRPYDGVDPAVERDPLLVALRVRLEDELLAALHADIEAVDHGRSAAVARNRGPGAAVDDLLAGFDGPSLSGFMEEHGTRRQFQEFLVHRSAYQLKEADPHTVGLARLPSGPRKSAYAEIQLDEYGNGVPGESHAELFAAAMRSVGLDDAYGRYLDLLPAATLATGNLLSLFASRRDLLGALVGHLALFEMTSVGPMGRYARAARRLGLGSDVERFFEVHVVADAHHGDLARRILLGDDPRVGDLDPADLVFGAHALLRIEDRFARRMLDAWHDGSSSLLAPSERDESHARLHPA